MRKKTFLQLHIGMLFVLLIYLTFLSIGLYVVIYGINCSNWFVILLGSLCGIFWVYQTIATFINHVTFDNDKISVFGDRLSRRSANQLKEEILYSEIVNITIIIANVNSKGKRFNTLAYSDMAPRSFFVFDMKNGKKKRIFIFPFSKKQRKQMLEIINKKTGMSWDYDTLYQQAFPKKKT